MQHSVVHKQLRMQHSAVHKQSQAQRPANIKPTWTSAKHTKPKGLARWKDVLKQKQNGRIILF